MKYREDSNWVCESWINMSDSYGYWLVRVDEFICDGFLPIYHFKYGFKAKKQ